MLLADRRCDHLRGSPPPTQPPPHRGRCEGGVRPLPAAAATGGGREGGRCSLRIAAATISEDRRPPPNLPRTADGAREESGPSPRRPRRGEVGRGGDAPCGSPLRPSPRIAAPHPTSPAPRTVRGRSPAPPPDVRGGGGREGGRRSLRIAGGSGSPVPTICEDRRPPPNLPRTADGAREESGPSPRRPRRGEVGGAAILADRRNLHPHVDQRALAQIGEVILCLPL